MASKPTEDNIALFTSFDYVKCLIHWNKPSKDKYPKLYKYLEENTFLKEPLLDDMCKVNRQADLALGYDNIKFEDILTASELQKHCVQQTLERLEENGDI